MSLPNYLAKIKSAGIYRFVWDKSTAPIEAADTLRLVVGYSEKGPFNTPVYIDNTADFIKIFGNINKKLEKRGVYFHRLALQSLGAGPILALNLKKFSGEQVEYVNVDVTYDTDASWKTKKMDVEKVFNTNRFWSLDSDVLPSNVEQIGDEHGYLTIAATDSKEASCSVFMRGYKPTGYDVTLKTWFKNIGEDLPSYAENYQNMKVSEFFAEVYVFRGEFTPAIARTEELKKYFDVVDDKVTLKPYLIDAFGRKVDTLETLASDENSNFVQVYRGTTIPLLKDLTGSYISLDLLFNGDNDTHTLLMNLDGNMLDNETITLDKISTTGWNKVTSEVLNGTVKINVLGNTNITPHITKATYESGEWNYVEDTNCLNGSDIIAYAVDSDDISTLAPEFASVGLVEGDYVLALVGSASDITGSTGSTGSTEATGSTGVTGSTSSASTTFSVRGRTSKKVSVVYITNIEYKYNKSNELTGVKISYSDPTAEAITIGDVKYLAKLENSLSLEIATMSPLYLKGYTYQLDRPKVGDKPSTSMIAKLNWQNEILDSLIKYKGLYEALTNNVDCEYHYIIDTFESYVDSSCKSKLSNLARDKDNALAILNFPSMKTFAECPYTSFADQDGFNIKYVVAGCNKRKPAAKLFTLPDINNGASWCAFYTPLMFSDGTIKTMVPSAALVGNLFMNKMDYAHPYSIVAGPNRGHVVAAGLVGPDYNYSRADLDLLEPFGVNCMVYVPRLGTQINSNQTAKQTPVSTLSRVHVRELIIYLQDEIAHVLQSYQWEFNTQALRDTIKAKADTILENVKNNGGVYNYKNICDSSNNSDDVINNQLLVLSTEIEPGMGAGKMVEEITLYRKGGMSSSAV